MVDNESSIGHNCRGVLLESSRIVLRPYGKVWSIFQDQAWRGSNLSVLPCIPPLRDVRNAPNGSCKRYDPAYTDCEHTSLHFLLKIADRNAPKNRPWHHVAIGVYPDNSFRWIPNWLGKDRL